MTASFMDTSAATYTPDAPTVSGGRQATIKYSDNSGARKYFIEVGEIDAVDFDEQITVSYADSTITCSVLDFCGLVLSSNTTAAMQNLAKTLIVYNTNAQAYFG